MRTLAIVLLMLGQLAAQGTPAPTIKACRANLKQWIPLFRCSAMLTQPLHVKRLITTALPLARLQRDFAQ